MGKLILVRGYAGKYTSNNKASEAQKRINKYIADGKLNLIASVIYKFS